MTGLVNPYAPLNNFGAAVDPHIGVPVRGYFGSAGTPAVTPALHANWDITTSAAQRPLYMLSELGAGNNANDTQFSETSTSVVNRAKRQHVTNVQVPSARTVPAGTSLKMVIGLSESNAAADDMLQMISYITDAAGTTIRGLLYAGQVGTTVSATVGANDEEISTSLLTRILQVTTPADVNCQTNDRWFVEIGYRATNTVGTSYGVIMRMNDQSSATGDLALTSGTNVSSGTTRPWVELNYDLFGV